MKTFDERCWKLCKRVPLGTVTTYREIARVLGTRGYRAVGRALHRSPGMKEGVPCHRVVRSDGAVGGFASGKMKKIEMLRKEDVVIVRGIVDLKLYFYRL